MEPAPFERVVRVGRREALDSGWTSPSSLLPNPACAGTRSRGCRQVWIRRWRPAWTCLAGLGPVKPRNCSGNSDLRASPGPAAARMGDNGGMTVAPKTPDEIERMRAAGRLAAEVLQVVAPHVKPGSPPRSSTASATSTSSTCGAPSPPTWATAASQGRLHLGQQRHLPRHPEPGQGAEGRRHRQHRRDRDRDGWHGDTSRMYFVGPRR